VPRGDTSWATAIVVEHAGKPQVIVPGTNRLRGYDLATGRADLGMRGAVVHIVASPVAANGFVYAAAATTRGRCWPSASTRPRDITAPTGRLDPQEGHAVRPSPLLYGDRSTTCRLPGRSRPAGYQDRRRQGGPSGSARSADVYASPSAPPTASTSPAAKRHAGESHGEPTPRMLAVNRLETVQRLGRPGRPGILLPRREHPLLHCGGVAFRPRAKGSTGRQVQVANFWKATWAVSPGKTTRLPSNRPPWQPDPQRLVTPYRGGIRHFTPARS